MGNTICFDASVYAPGTKHATHQHQTLQLSLVLAGSVSERVGSRIQNARALSVVAKDPGVDHSDDFGPGARMIRLNFPEGTLADLIDDPARAECWIWTHTPRVAKPFLRLAQRARLGVVGFAGDDEDIVDLLSELTARVATTTGSPPRWLEDLMLELRSAWSPSTTVRQLAARARVHPVYLARCVRRWYGTGLAEELRRLRLQSAAAALGHSRATVSTIAYSNGFSDEPHLCRDFGNALGVTPRRFRSIVSGLA